MKKTGWLLVLGMIVLSCGTIIESDYHKYKEGIRFKVKRSSATPTTSSDLNTTTIDIGGTRFVTLQMLFDNNSGVTQEIDFNEIFLVDETGGKHAVTKAAKNFGVVDYDNFEFTLKKGKERLFIVTFSGFPKNEQVNKFEMEGNIITIR